MSATSLDVVAWGRERIRTGPWRGDPSTAYLSPVPDAPVPSPEFLRRCLDGLRGQGFTRVVTAALSPVEQTGFLAVGFGVHENLHLLGIDLRVPLVPVPPGHRLARPGRRRRDAVLAVDGHAFAPFWRFDEAGLHLALAATPSTRFRVALDPEDRSVEGYAIIGRAGRRGYVQRLAVDPGRQRAGTGRRLLLDGLHWLQQRGAEQAVVNTQYGNLPALGLYHATGFRDEPTGLSVLTAGLR